MKHGVERATHECAVPGCGAGIPRGRLMCWGHWELVPADLRRAVNRTWRLFKLNFGDRVSRDEYNAARDAAIKAVTE